MAKSSRVRGRKPIVATGRTVASGLAFPAPGDSGRANRTRSAGLRDPVAAPLRAREQVLVPLDDHAVTQRLTEQLQLGRAQAEAHAGGVADRAVVLGEHERVAVGGRLGDVALGSADVGQPADLHGDVRTVVELLAVRTELALASGADDLTERVLAERLADRLDELDGEVGMTVGEQLGRHRRQPPVDRWPT